MSDDLFGEDNIEYMNTKAFPEFDFEEEVKPEIQQKFMKQQKSFQFIKNEKLQMINEIQNFNTIQLSNDFGVCFFQTPTNLDIFSSQQIRDKYQNQLIQIKKKEYNNSQFENLKNLYIDYFSSPKSIKFSNILFFNEDIEIINPSDFLEYKYNAILMINNPVYYEFLDWYLDQNFLNFDRYFTIIYEKDKIDNNKIIKNQNLIQLKKIDQKTLQQYQELDKLDFIFCALSINLSEQEFYPYFLMYVCISGLLLKDSASNLIIKIGNNFQPRTNELIFLMYQMFDNIQIIRPISSNIFSNEKYLIGTNFKVNCGRQIGSQILKSFDYLIQNQNKCLLDISTITSDNYFIMNLIETLNKDICISIMKLIEKQIDKQQYCPNHGDLIKQEMYKWKWPIQLANPEQKVKKQDDQKQRQIHQDFYEEEVNYQKKEIYEDHFLNDNDLLDILPKVINNKIKKQNIKKPIQQEKQQIQENKLQNEFNKLFNRKRK